MFVGRRVDWVGSALEGVKVPLARRGSPVDLRACILRHAVLLEALHRRTIGHGRRIVPDSRDQMLLLPPERLT
jgi:hypothetical protein